MISHISSHIHHDKKNNDLNDKMQKYIQGLEAERQKIRVFERELPLCLQLVTQAIEDCKQKHLGKEGGYTISDCSESEQTSTEEPISEEIIKKSSVIKDNKSEWLRSAQLWNQNQTADPPSPDKDFLPKRVLAMEVNRNGIGIGGAFHPFKKGEQIVGTKDAHNLPSPAVVGSILPNPAVAAGSSTAETGGSNGGKSTKEVEKESESKRKTRRSWSPELHKRFMRALEQLGGSNVATPKQIRELMKVDGLTNDEVKSHLQKYRLHNRRSNSSIHNNNPQQPQFVVVGGIWVPPPEYAAAAMAATTNCGGAATTNGIYAPIATLATPFDDASTSAKHRPRTCNNDSDHNSQASSSSSETTTTSPDC